jgi:hypothetical protein
VVRNLALERVHHWPWRRDVVAGERRLNEWQIPARSYAEGRGGGWGRHDHGTTR